MAIAEQNMPADTPDYRAANSAQAEAADPAHSAWVVANAGSGKTKVLIDRVARLLLGRPDEAGAKPDSILCITYTKAAANEMLSRLYATLGEWSVLEDRKLAGLLAKLVGRTAEAFTDDELKNARRLFAQALETPGGLRIETIHAFCARVLRRFPLEAGVAPGFTEIEDSEASRLWQEAQREAVLAADPAALDILALAAGHDGATSALNVLRGVQAEALAFAEIHGGDALAMEAVLREALNAPEASPDELIVHAMGDAFPEQEVRAAIGLLIAGGAKGELTAASILEAVFEAGDARQKFEAYLSLFLTQSGSPRASNPYNKGTGEASPLLVELFQMKGGQGREAARMLDVMAQMQAAEAVERSIALLDVGLPALRAYKQKKRARAALDFDDLIERTRDLLTMKDASDWVLYKLDGGLSHILLDEAQDTSPGQWTLINALKEEFFSGAGTEQHETVRTQFVVGDGKQSIYSFQGADPERFASERQVFSGLIPKPALPEMAMSFRSSPEVLSFVDEVWKGQPDAGAAFEVKMPTGLDTPKHTARRSEQPGRVELWPLAPLPLEDDDVDAWARPKNVLSDVSPKASLATEIAVKIKNMITRGDTVWEEQKHLKGRPWVRRACRAEDFLILVRNRQGGLFDALISGLKRADVPVAGADRLVLADHIGVKDCLNLMRFALLPEDDLTLAEILRGPFCGLVDDDKHLFPLAYKRGKASVWSQLQAHDDPVFAEAKAFLCGLRERVGMPPYEFLSTVLEQTQPSGKTGWEHLNARLGTPARDPVEALLARAIAHDARAPSSLQGFVSAMERDDSQIKRDLAKADGEVRVMTVHGAKGLEAPIVILPDTTSKPKAGAGPMFMLGGAPVWSPRKDVDTPQAAAARASASARALREHYRLLYVALTRAQDRLIIAGSWFGGARSKTGCDERSWYAICQAAMAAMPGAEQDDDGVFALGASPSQMPHKGVGGGLDATLPEWVMRPAPENASTARLVAPSALLPRDVPVLAPFGEARAARLKRGRMIHSLLQYLPEMPPEARRAAGEEFLSRDAALDEAARADMLSAAMGVLESDELAELFAPGGRAEAAVIGTAPELPDGTIINGRVDRLVVTDTHVLIVDFKTDQPGPATIDDIADSYTAQMAAYWAVLKQAYTGKIVQAALCWTDGPQLMVLPDARLLEVLNRVKSVV